MPVTKICFPNGLSFPSSERTIIMSVRIILYNYAAQYNMIDNLPSYAPDNHHRSEIVYWRGSSSSSISSKLYNL